MMIDWWWILVAIGGTIFSMIFVSIFDSTYAALLSLIYYVAHKDNFEDAPTFDEYPED